MSTSSRQEPEIHYSAQLLSLEPRKYMLPLKRVNKGKTVQVGRISERWLGEAPQKTVNTRRIQAELCGFNAVHQRLFQLEYRL